LSDAGFDVVTAELSVTASELHRGVESAIRSGIPMVCVGGGDGTLSGVAKLFARKDCTFGILPMGTGNSLARDLQIPVNLGEAVKVLVDGKELEIDLGEVDGNAFVNIATVGLTTLIAENLDSNAKRRFGRAAYLMAMFKALTKARRFSAKIRIGSEELHFRSIQLVIGNGRFHAGPFPITPDSEINSGYLTGYTVNTSRRAVLLRYALRLWHGRHVDMPEVVPFQGTEIELETTPRQRITVDGEVKQSTPALFRSLPKSLKVKIPKDSNPTEQA
jgi:YegS/Rv2252/BmrU family lipid kinase